jgi:hypothetical protein
MHHLVVHCFSGHITYAADYHVADFTAAVDAHGVEAALEWHFGERVE